MRRPIPAVALPAALASSSHAAAITDGTHDGERRPARSFLADFVTLP